MVPDRLLQFVITLVKATDDVGEDRRSLGLIVEWIG